MRILMRYRTTISSSLCSLTNASKNINEKFNRNDSINDNIHIFQQIPYYKISKDIKKRLYPHLRRPILFFTHSLLFIFSIKVHSRPLFLHLMVEYNINTSVATDIFVWLFRIPIFHIFQLSFGKIKNTLPLMKFFHKTIKAKAQSINSGWSSYTIY
jgi:hypothetical protein